MIKLKYKPDPKWKDFYKGEWQTAILIGGRGSGKTWNAGNFTALETFKNPNYRTLVLRDVSSSISQSILQNIKGRFSTILTKLEGSFDHVFEIQENQIKNKIHDLVNILTKGFRQSRVEQQADLKGFEDIDLALIEEAEDLRDVDRVNTLIDTLRKEGHKVIIILNTPDLEHWIVKKYFDYELSEFGGFFKLIPKKLNNVCQVIVNYRDNPHLTPTKAKDYASYNDPTSENYNPDHYAGKILGLATENQNVLRKFNSKKVLAIKTVDPLEVLDQVKIFRMPEANQIYSFAIDPSSGLGKDYTAFTVRGFYPNKEGKYPLYAQMKAKVDEETTVRLALNLANWFGKFGKVLIAPESNFGSYVTTTIKNSYDQDLVYKRYYQDPTVAYDKLIGDFGFKTTSTNRDNIINEYVTMFKMDKLEILNKDETDEMLNFVWNDEKKRYEALEPAHDDLLFSDFICVAGFDYIRQYL